MDDRGIKEGGEVYRGGGWGGETSRGGELERCRRRREGGRKGTREAGDQPMVHKVISTRAAFLTR